jgi:hypothetical protein
MPAPPLDQHLRLVECRELLAVQQYGASIITSLGRLVSS